MRVLMICPQLPTVTNPGSMAPGARQMQSIAAAGLDVEILDLRGIPKLKYLQILPKVQKHIRSADLVHCHFGYCGWLGLAGRLMAMRRTPIVMSFMGDDLLGTPTDEQGQFDRGSLWVASWNRRLAHRFDQVIVKSKEMAERLSPVACHVIPNGVDFNVFQPKHRQLARTELNWTRTGRKVLFPGDPANPRKGFGLAQAAVHVAEQHLGESLELVPLWGVKPDQVATYMNACDAMLMTSLIEGSPNVVKEALACDANVIGVPVGDVHEMLGGVEGCCCTSRDASEIGSALVRVLGAARQSNGRDVLRQRGLSLEGVAQKIISVYRQALQLPQPDSTTEPKPSTVSLR